MIREREEKPEPVAEYDCCECGCHIYVFVGKIPEFRLCGACVHIPGWHADPYFRSLIAPDLGRERAS